MAIEIIVSIGGAIMSGLLVINSFFARKTLEKISDVELKLAVLIANHDATEERSRLNSDRHHKNETELIKVRERLHALEGGQMQMLSLVEDCQSKHEGR